MTAPISAWEDEGGALATRQVIRLTGSIAQVAWAERIRGEVDREFDRVRSALESRRRSQSGAALDRTRIIIAILEEKRAEVMGNDRAGYFIRDWQELSDQVRLMILHDPRFDPSHGRSR